MAELCDRFLAEHVVRKRPTAQAGYRHIIERRIKPTLGRKSVAAIDVRDVEKLHTEISAQAPLLANRTLAVLSKMMTFAIKLKMRAENPAKGIERNAETSRRRYLDNGELTRLTRALAEHDDQQMANAVRLLCLVGARKNEVLSARWAQFDFQRNVWRKESHETKQRRVHEVPLSDAALALLRSMRKVAPDDAQFLFPGHGSSGHLTEIRAWADICQRANIADLHIHDLRHSHASWLASAGYSLQLIGALLGHNSPSATFRYAHLLDSPQREAVNRIGAQLRGLVAKRPKRGKLKVVVS